MKAKMDPLGAEHDFETRGSLGEEGVYKLRKTLKRSRNMKTQKAESQAPVSGGKLGSIRENWT